MTAAHFNPPWRNKANEPQLRVKVTNEIISFDSKNTNDPLMN